jgi:ABC-type enterochelin transport system permease subunit
MPETKRENVALSLWVWLPAIFILYFIFDLIVNRTKMLFLDDIRSFIGLFVPNLIGTDLDLGSRPKPYVPFACLSLGIVVIGGCDWLARRQKFPIWVRLPYNLAILFALNFVIERLILRRS